MIRMAVTLMVAAAATMTSPAPAQTGSAHTMQAEALNETVSAYLADRASEFDQIDTDRRALLERVAAYVAEASEKDEPVRMIFVCTHNSRRSHMSQLWAAAAAEAYGLQVETYSGGTEDTAFNPRAVASLQRAGMEITQTTTARNPIYHVSFGPDSAVQTCFSKAYDAPPNPREAFCAVMVCNDADEKCPYVAGAEARFAVPFVDPKVSDDTPKEAATYDERCAQIAREMAYIMAHAAG